MDRTDKREELALRRHGQTALVLVVLLSLVLVGAVSLAVTKMSPVGVYRFVYEESADGDRDYGQAGELRLERGGRAVYSFGHGGIHEELVGTWTSRGRTVSVVFGQERAEYEWEGDCLYERKDGTETCYEKE